MLPLTLAAMAMARYKDYAGPLYTLKRNYDNTTLDILPKGDGSGFADSAAQVAFCTTPKVSVCIVERIYDQSLKGNHLERIKVFGNDTHGWYSYPSPSPPPTHHAPRTTHHHLLRLPQKNASAMLLRGASSARRTHRLLPDAVPRCGTSSLHLLYHTYARTCNVYCFVNLYDVTSHRL